MTNYARIIDNMAVDVCNNPNTDFHPTIAAEFVSVPDQVQRGWLQDGNEWVATEPLGPPARTWSVSDIRAGLTLSEKVKWDNDLAPEVKTAKTELTSPKELVDVTELLTFLVDASVISQASMSKILQ